MALWTVPSPFNLKKSKGTKVKNKKILVLAVVILAALVLTVYLVFVRLPHEKRIADYSETIQLVQNKNAKLDDLLSQAQSLASDPSYSLNEETKKALNVAISNGKKVEIKLPTTFEEANKAKKILKKKTYTAEIKQLKAIVHKITAK